VGSARAITLACALLCALPSALYPGEADLRKQINALYREGNSAALDDAVASFVNKFPKSEFAPEARMRAAELVVSPGEALSRYRQVRDGYPSYPERSLAALRACEILYLSTRWDELIEDARAGLAASPAGAYSLRMKLLLGRGLIQRERFDEARAAVADVIANHHDYDGLAEALLLSSYIERRATGYSRAYLAVLRELVVGFPDSASAASGLYLLGRYYEKREDYDRACSAMQDVVKRYPSSPEAGYARERIGEYGPHGPRRVDYLPDESQMKSADVLDISPETRYPPKGEGAQSYAVALGPFYEAKDAKEIVALIKGEFSPVETVKVGGRYTIYVGRLDDVDAALAVKTRLAEEYALNGGVVRIKKSGNKQYIYGE
jgi:outer membrane protein assembly factor BamD (BamD/ComL family)